MTTQNPANYYQHPVFDPLGGFLSTAPYTAFQEQVTRWLWTGSVGGYVLGPARTGKTTATERLATTLRWRDRSTPLILFVSIPRRDRHTITEAWRVLCLAHQIPVTNASKSGVMAGLFMHYLLDRCHQQQAQRIVLLVDEVQRFSAEQLGIFAEIYDHCRALYRPVMTILVGNDEEGVNLYHTVQDQQYASIRGRFFTQTHRFDGLTSSAHFESCLAQYDTLRYPADTGPTFTEFFLPKAFAQGFRLADLARPLWTVFRDYKKAYGIPSLGLQYFRAVVDPLLTDRLRHLDPFHLEREVIEACFEESGLLASVVQAEP